MAAAAGTVSYIDVDQLARLARSGARAPPAQVRMPRELAKGKGFEAD